MPPVARLTSNAPQGYRLGLPNAAHTLPACAAVYEKNAKGVKVD